MRRLNKFPTSLGTQYARAAMDVLRKYGANAHLYLPGVGAINGITAGNWQDSAGTIAATVDNPIGLIQDSIGGIHASQATTAAKPILRLNSGIYSAQFDGVDDYLSLGSVPFQMTDNFAIVVGHVNNDTSGYPMAYGQQKVGSLHRFELFSALGKPAISFLGSLDQYIVGPDMTNGQKLVQSCRKVGGIAAGRVNGVSIGQADVSGNTMQVHDAATIGANNGGLNNFCVGSIYPVIAIKGTVSDADLLTLEKFVASLSGVTL